jgi:tripartite-type tricarboxylate transporter receptor subunit TctC
MKLAVVAAVLATVLNHVTASPAEAQAYPQKPVKIVVPYAAGGNTDAIARVTAQRLAAGMGQQFVVENRVGAGGAIAAEYVARAAADGYTLCLCALSQLGPVPLTQKVAYDPLKDFTPISNIGANGFVITVTAKLPVKTLAEFVDYAKSRPGQLNYGSGGTGSLTHLAAALFLHRAGLQMTHVPYKGGAPALTDTIAGQVEMYAASPSEVEPHVGSGNLRLLGISTSARIKQLPDVPAIAELYPGFVAVTWNGLLGPAGMPAAVVERLGAELQAAMKEPDFLDRLEKIGVDPAPTTPAQFAAEIRDEYAMWRDVIKDAGILVE